jgi:HlyD family secretion protein
MSQSQFSPSEPLPSLHADEFLPPLRPWVVRGAFLLVGLLVSGVGLASLIPYNVTVAAIATLRPVTEVSSVQARTSGTLQRVLVQENQSVKQGEVLAELGVIDPAQLLRLQTRRQQLYSYIQQYQMQLNQVQSQLQTQPETGEVANRWPVQRDRLQQQQAGLTRQIGYDQISLQAIDTELSKVVILVPTDGRILKLNLRNPGQPIQPGDVVAQIVPSPMELVAKARVAVQDISQIEVGQAAQLRISAYPYPDYGVLTGTVQAIAPDTTPANHPVTGLPTAYYEVTIRPTQPYLAKGDRQYPLQPGMEAEADIISRQETLMQAVWRKLRLWAEV